MTQRTVDGLARAGCREVWLGAESGSQKILDAMDKGISAPQISVARARLGAAGIRACFFIQFGYPSEEFGDILATVQMVRDTLPDDIGVSVSYPLPGTSFHAAVREQLGAKTNWEDSGDLAMMFQGTYASPFYRRLHGLLHRDLDARRRAVSGGDSARSKAELDALRREWAELGRAEANARNAAPTAVVLGSRRPAAPDLTRDWN
jgi:anaerobic magnesium-protoporphyrin IX monomethyl ester cyclase